MNLRERKRKWLAHIRDELRTIRFWLLQDMDGMSGLDREELELEECKQLLVCAKTDAEIRTALTAIERLMRASMRTNYGIDPDQVTGHLH